jgi:hypothetical protein
MFTILAELLPENDLAGEDQQNKQNPRPLVRKRTIQSERLPLVDEI